ncbi:MAG TPA: hypothetical protein VKB88_02640 [Bryobacteraceae bacterium]|nr:hypothetical protein [Bryobacteraceae bacterium]
MNPVTEKRTDGMGVREERSGRRPESVDEPTAALLPGDFTQDLQRRWDQVQTGFVDEPRTAVQQADELVGLAIDRLSQSFTAQRKTLEEQWGKGGDVSTEDLRQALRRYRAFFQRLLVI